MKKATAVFSVVLIAFALWVISLTASLGRTLIAYDIGPAAYPRLLCYVLLGLAALLFVLDCLVKKTDEPLRFLSWRNVAHLALMAAFLLCFNFLGFPICAFAVIAIVMKIMGCPRLWQILLFSALTSGAVYAIFKVLLNVRLPLGLLDYIL